MEELERIQSNWNTSFEEKGQQCYELGKTAGLSPEQRKMCFEAAVYYYEHSETENILCNLAHCYFILARLFGVQSEEYYKRSIECHIKGSKNKNYQYQDFYKFYDVNENNIDLILRTIRLVKPSSFNDPTDCSIVQEGLNQDIFPTKSVFDGLRVCCFGLVEGKQRAWEDSKKWAYYGAGSKGICIRYRFFNDVLEKGLGEKFVFNAVEYKDVFEFDRGIVADGFMSKTKDYEEENEWRLVWYDRDYNCNQNYWSKDGNIYLPIGKENIYQVFIGCRCPETIAQSIINYIGGVKYQVMKIQPDLANVFKLKSYAVD